MSIAFLAYFIDRIFAEFSFIRHPVRYMGDLIVWYEKRFYKDTIFRGVLLVLLSVTLFGAGAYLIETFVSFFPIWLEIVVLATLASIFIAHRMLYESVLAVADAQKPNEKVAMIVSRDCKDLDNADSYKAAIESYAENLSDGVIAPMFYLFIFGFSALVVYKVINTLDSMVGYKNARYINFGKAAARLDDVANFIPSRVTALLIALLFLSKKALQFNRYAKGHESPNAGYPISAMALYLGVALGGDTSYFGKVKKKPYFGEGRKEITQNDVYRALALRSRLDILMGVAFLWSLYAF